MHQSEDYMSSALPILKEMSKRKLDSGESLDIEFVNPDFCWVENNLLENAELNLIISQNDYLLYPDSQDFFYSVLRVIFIIYFYLIFLT